MALHDQRRIMTTNQPTTNQLYTYQVWRPIINKQTNIIITNICTVIIQHAVMLCSVPADHTHITVTGFTVCRP